MIIALAQMDVIPGRPDKNVPKMLEFIEQAKKSQADVVAFPEMSVAGYCLSDLWTNETFCREMMTYNDVLREASKDIAVIYGNIFVDDRVDQNKTWRPNKDGRVRKYNAAYVYQDQRPVSRTFEMMAQISGLAIKTLLPNYRMFDDERYFLSYRDFLQDYGLRMDQGFAPFEIFCKSEGKYRNIGVTICEDIFCRDYRFENKPLNPTVEYIKNGADAIVNISASPWTLGKNGTRDRWIKEIEQDMVSQNYEFKPLFYVNCVGVQNNGKNIITFDGGSTIYDYRGNIAQLGNNEYREELLVADTTEKWSSTQRPKERVIRAKYHALVRGIQSMKDMMGLEEQPKWALGTSGGLDSCTVAVLLVKAVGKDKVLAINMPTENNSQKTQDLAKQIAEKLGIRYQVVPLGNLYAANKDALQPILPVGKDFTGLTLENIQARLRGSAILAGVSAIEGALFTNNGNKLETCVGYNTAYGDLNGSIAVLGDMLKVEVFELAKYINDEVFKEEIIPHELFPDELYRFGEGKVASGPELTKGQVSQLRIGYHDYILAAFTDFQKKSPEDILQWYLEGSLEDKLCGYGMRKGMLARYGMNDPKAFVQDLEWFCKKLQCNIWKRIQAPPIIITSKSSYGYDIRESQLPFLKSKKYVELEKKVLAMCQKENV